VLFARLDTAENSKPELYNQFLFCNKFLLFVRYLHGGRQAKKIWAAIGAVHIFLSELSFYIYDIFF